MHGVESPCQMPVQQRRAKTDVLPAAKWFLLAGERIYEVCKDGRDRQGRGYSLYRWALWKRNFVESVMNERLTDDIKYIASQAASKMAKIEG